MLITNIFKTAYIKIKCIFDANYLGGVYMKIFIDPGHGGNDTGAVGNGLIEKDLVLDISLRQKELFEKLGHQVKMSRITDRYVYLSSRTSEANNWGADVFISNHINQGGGVGVEVWHSIYGGKGQQYATDVVMNLSEIFKSRGTKSRKGINGDYFYIIRATDMPAILNEIGFIDSLEDSEKLSKADIRQKCAEAVVYGILGQRVPKDMPSSTSKLIPKLTRLLRYTTPMLRGEDVRLVQSILNNLGYAAGAEDGILGTNTDRAIRAFQKAKGLVVDGIIGENTWAKLME